MTLPLPDPVEYQGLDQHVDWMSYSHEQLYDMVNNGVDLTGATEVAGSWAQLSDTLLQMGNTLNAALAASTDGWQGSAADQARSSLGGLANWTNSTGENAVVVSGCVSRQAEALQTARSAMPAPPPAPIVIPVDRTGPFAQPPIATPGPIASTRTAVEAHQQAARVMQQYQSSSADIARTIPQFAAPTNPVNGPVQPPAPTPVPPPGGAPHPGPAPIGGGFSRVAPGGSMPAEETGGVPPRGPGGTTGIESPQQESPARTGSGFAAEAETTQGVRTGMPAAGMAGAGGRREEDGEHKRRYWQADDGLFDVETRIGPRVIGDEKRD
ncbi:MAG TPA: hypothetical protein VJ914_31225 [Pseudonocardiaceae bacterium]|nr:hypothetical protein [Pseudonocardiaceae bacterium]